MPATLKIADVIRALEARAPSQTAESWDNVGLLAGDPEWKATGAIVSIDLTEDALEQAIAKKCQLIVTHHPCIFPKQRGWSRVLATPHSAQTSSLVFRAIREGIAIASYHTNFDQCALEVIEAVSGGLKAEPRGRLFDHSEDSLLKLGVFVPREHVEKVRDAICEAGAGHIGNYDFCTFGTIGMGTFRGGKDSNPFIGKPGRLEKAEEIRLETVIPRGLKHAILQAMHEAHPYEEVAYDLYPVEQAPLSKGLVRGLGYGFWGEIPSPKPFSEFAKDVTNLFETIGFWLTDPPPSRVRRVAFVAGKGTSFLESAFKQGCDLFITGEAGYHAALDGMRRGMAVMELGHRESEKFFLHVMKDWLSEIGLKSAIIQAKTQKIWTPGGKK